MKWNGQGKVVECTYTEQSDCCRFSMEYVVSMANGNFSIFFEEEELVIISSSYAQGFIERNKDLWVFTASSTHHSKCFSNGFSNI